MPDRRARRCPADLVEEEVLAIIADGVLPISVIDAARSELRNLLETPDVAVAGVGALGWRPALSSSRRSMLGVT